MSRHVTRLASVLVLALGVRHGALAAAPALRVLEIAPAQDNLVVDGGFEALKDAPGTPGRRGAWAPWQDGFTVAPGAGRNGSTAVLCARPAGAAARGLSQALNLNRAAVAPLLVRAWSKAQAVTGSPDGDYSVYVDLVYQDGDHLWGQTGAFRCGTHDWQQQEVTILPEKPVRSLTVYCLLRGEHHGQAWFDDVEVCEPKTGGRTLLFQSVPVEVVPAPPGRDQPATSTLATQDGLSVALREDAVAAVRVDGRDVTSPAPGAPGGFLVRDAAANSSFFPFERGTCAEVGVKLEAQYVAKADHILVRGKLSDTTGKDRALTLVFALPVDATGWQWGQDIRRSQKIEGAGELANVTRIGCGSTGTLSLYPLAAIHDARSGLALALDMGQPAQYRVAYHAGTKQLFIAYDFGLVNAGTGAGVAAAPSFAFVLYRFDPAWGFRAAFDKLTAIFPDYFAVRCAEQGIWMPFTDISKVDRWQDFGFKFHEGNNNVAFDDSANILSFRYSEPMTWWMRLDKGAPRTVAEALRVRDAVAKGTNAGERGRAQACAAAGMFDPDGQPQMLFRNTPWCDGVVWSLNPCPFLPGAPGQPNGASVHWNAALKERLYGPSAKGVQDGEYLDSLEGYVTADLNYRREHFAYSTVPLTFASDTHQPALYKGLAVFEFTKWLCDDVHRMGKLTFANGVPYRYTFLCPWLDVMGTETDWLHNGKYAPSGDATMSLWRTMSGRKPYLLLMNTDFEALAPHVERYFQRALFYGMFPSMFSHNASEDPYWQKPAWYNRDRELFKKYQPLIKRVAEAGWRPVTGARSDNPAVGVERFGPPDPGKDGAVFVTVLNDTAAAQSATVTLEAALLKLPATAKARELISGRDLPLENGKFAVRLQPQEAWAVEVK